jgi:hypothetical protein
MTLGDAITAVETAATEYDKAVQTTSNDSAAAAAIQTKLDAANKTVAYDVEAQAWTAKAFNGALDGLIEAATAAKIPTVG